MAPPTEEESIELLERGMVDLRASMAGQVDRLTSTVEQMMQRLEATMSKAKEEQDLFLNEIRMTISSLKRMETTPFNGSNSPVVQGQEMFQNEMRLAISLLEKTELTQDIGVSSPAGCGLGHSSGHESGQSPGPGSGTGRIEIGSGRIGEQMGSNGEIREATNRFSLQQIQLSELSRSVKSKSLNEVSPYARHMFDESPEKIYKSPIPPTLVYSPKTVLKEIVFKLHEDERGKCEVLAENNEHLCDVIKGPIKIHWFNGDVTNNGYNCLDKNIEFGNGDKVAIYWEGNEAGADGVLTYTEWLQRVCQLANFTKDNGVEKGNAVLVYLPRLMELPIATLACARIGAVHSVAFVGFSAESVARRIIDCGLGIVITCKAVMRGPKIINLKNIVDAALDEASHKGITVDECLTYENESATTGKATTGQAGRDIGWQDVVPNYPQVCDVVWVDARMLVQHVYPVFSSPFGHLRAKAAWVAGQYVHSNFSDKDNFRKSLLIVVAEMRDSELPVRVESVFALRSFVEACKDLNEIRLMLPQLLDEFFKLMNEIENEDLVFTLETIVDKFGEEMTPYTFGLCQNLEAAFWKRMNTAEADDEAVVPGTLVAVGCLRATSTVLDSKSCRSGLQGRGLHRFWENVEGNKGPLLMLIATSSGDDQEGGKDVKEWMVGALTDQGFENKHTFYGSSSSLYALSPVFHTFSSSGKEKNFICSRLHPTSRLYEPYPKPVGIGFGETIGNNRILLDEDFASVTLNHHVLDKTYQPGSLCPGQGYLPLEASVLDVASPRKVMVELPVRVDLVGGRSDTPPWSLERVGCVLNMAIILEDSLPMGTIVETTKTTGTWISDEDSNQLYIEYIASITTPLEISDPFRLVKSALLVLVSAFHLEDKVAVWVAGNAMTSSGPPIQYIC